MLIWYVDITCTKAPAAHCMILQILLTWCELLEVSHINSDDLSVCIDSVRYVRDHVMLLSLLIPTSGSYSQHIDTTKGYWLKD